MLTTEQTVIHEKAVLISGNFKRTEIELIEILQDVRQKNVFLALGFSSLFEYGTECLGLSAANAYTYTKIAKTAEAIPELKSEIKSGSLTITNARRIIPILTQDNKVELLQQATTLSAKALEKVVASIHPENVRESIRVVAPERLSLKLGISEEIMKKLKRAQALLSNQKRKTATFEEVLEASLDQFLERKDPIKQAERSKTLVSRPKPTGGMVTVAKRIPLAASLRHEIFRRDHGQCAYKRSNGSKCANTHFIEIHHRTPVSRGGQNELSNLITLCGAHHGYVHSKI